MTPEEIAGRLGGRAELSHGHLRWWVPSPDDDPSPAIAAVAHELGLVATRRLHQMRRSLPLDPAVVADVPTIATRAFRPGDDDDSWLTVNNAAFAQHPDQAGWTEADLDRRVAEPWFDADGFRIAEADGEMIGFCWTKVHPTDPPMGEIYVIGADPAHQGHGIGASLTIAGLGWLWRERATPVAMLYVESTNDSALRLYRRLGFAVHHTDICFEPSRGDT